MKLTSAKVEEIFFDSMFREEEINPTTNLPDQEYIIVEGIVASVGFHPGRLKGHKAEIVELLHELPDEFKYGWSFLNACEDKHGELWGQHMNIDQLVMLGLGVGAVEFCAPREMWSALPGGMPYFQIKDGEVDDK